MHAHLLPRPRAERPIAESSLTVAAERSPAELASGGQTCGGAGVAGHCGAPSCIPRTCAQVNANCGLVGDGCGGSVNCGTCPTGQSCGAFQPNSCGGNAVDAGACTGLCLKQTTCAPGATTSLSGVVLAPDGIEPLPNAVVYVPNAAVQPFTAGVSCSQCGSDVSGSPLVKAFTSANGTFSLTNVPVSANANDLIPVVIQLGRWRRQIQVHVPGCVDTALPATLTHLPKNKGEGNIPLTAIVTGSADALECVFRKMGIDDEEFTNPGSPGRIQFYKANGATISKKRDPNGHSTPDESTLWSSPSTLATYDQVIFRLRGG